MDEIKPKAICIYLPKKDGELLAARLQALAEKNRHSVSNEGLRAIEAHVEREERKGRHWEE